MTFGPKKSKPVAEIAPKACIGCEQCIPVCPVEAISMDSEGLATIDVDACTGCRQCVEVCSASAITVRQELTSRNAEASSKVSARQEPISVQGEVTSEVWVFVEHADGRPASVSWELLGKGAGLASDLGGQVCGVILGHNVDPLAAEAFSYGAEKVYVIDNPSLAQYRNRPYLMGLVGLVQKHHPAVFLLGATTTGRDLAGAVATSLQTGLTADCTGLAIDPNTKLLEQTRPAYGGNIMATILCEQRRPQMATVRPRVVKVPVPNPSHTGEVVREEISLVGEDLVVCILDCARETNTEYVHIENADILVSGGRGLGGPEGFDLLADLARALGGVVSGSRGAVDQGWIDHSRQVGQTGKTVRPRLYLACGISGAIQHLVGMETADVIVAINRDHNAPIFDVATYGIVGDAKEIVPALTRALKTRLPGRGGADE